jgi:hypothetical protein
MFMDPWSGWPFTLLSACAVEPSGAVAVTLHRQMPLPPANAGPYWNVWPVDLVGKSWKGVFVPAPRRTLSCHSNL